MWLLLQATPGTEQGRVKWGMGRMSYCSWLYNRVYWSSSSRHQTKMGYVGTNEWMDEWMNEWMNKWMNEWMNRWKMADAWWVMNEWMNGRKWYQEELLQLAIQQSLLEQQQTTNQPTKMGYVGTKECMHGWKMNEWMSEWMNEWMSEWMNEWVNDWEEYGEDELLQLAIQHSLLEQQQQTANQDGVCRNKRVGGWMDGWMDGWMIGCID